MFKSLSKPIIPLIDKQRSKFLLESRCPHSSQAYNSEWKNGPLVTVVCAALAGTLFESGLFGHEKSASLERPAKGWAFHASGAKGLSLMRPGESSYSSEGNPGTNTGGDKSEAF